MTENDSTLTEALEWAEENSYSMEQIQAWGEQAKPVLDKLAHDIAVAGNQLAEVLTKAFLPIANAASETLQRLEPYTVNAQRRAEQMGMSFDDYMTWLKAQPPATRTREFEIILTVL